MGSIPLGKGAEPLGKSSVVVVVGGILKLGLWVSLKLTRLFYKCHNVLIIAQPTTLQSCNVTGPVAVGGLVLA